MKKIFAAIAAIGFLSASCLTATSGLGVIKTSDGGATWQPAVQIDGVNDTIAGSAVAEMGLNPFNHEQIFMAAASGGFWVSDNSASTWREILSKLNAYDFALNPINPNTIFVVGIYGTHGKIVRTTDGGASWNEVYNEASANNSVNTIAINPNNPQEIYAGLNSGVVIKSADNGQTWTVVKEFGDQLLKLRYSKFTGGLYALLATKGVQKSADNGATWTNTTVSLTGSNIVESFTSSIVDSFTKMALDDNQGGIIYITTSKGLYRTTNDGQSWDYVNMPVRSSAELPRAVASARGGTIVFASIGSTLFKSLDGAKTWQTQSLPTQNSVNKIIIDPILPQVDYAGLINK